MTTQLMKNARKYLLTFDGIDNQIIDLHLKSWKTQRSNSLSQLFQSMANHAKNRHSMPNTIGDLEKLKEVLFGFQPNKVCDAYNDHITLLSEIKKNKIKTPMRIDIQNNKSHWVIYAKSLISSAKFLSSFRSANEFHEFVESFYNNQYSRLALPLLLKEEISGFGFALACDFLKENGYSGFIKPDTHIKSICRAAGISDADSDFGVFKDVIIYCDENALVPYEFDKLLWLVGSGNFYRNNIVVPTNKTNFIKQYLGGN